MRKIVAWSCRIPSCSKVSHEVALFCGTLLTSFASRVRTDSTSSHTSVLSALQDSHFRQHWLSFSPTNVCLLRNEFNYRPFDCLLGVETKVPDDPRTLTPLTRWTGTIEWSAIATRHQIREIVRARPVSSRGFRIAEIATFKGWKNFDGKITLPLRGINVAVLAGDHNLKSASAFFQTVVLPLVETLICRCYSRGTSGSSNRHGERSSSPSVRASFLWNARRESTQLTTATASPWRSNVSSISVARETSGTATLGNLLVTIIPTTGSAADYLARTGRWVGESAVVNVT